MERYIDPGSENACRLKETVSRHITDQYPKRINISVLLEETIEFL